MTLKTFFGLGAAFFDIFGIFIFVFIVGSALWALNKKRRLPDWVLLTYIAIGLLGFFIDLLNVYSAFLRLTA